MTDYSLTVTNRVADYGVTCNILFVGRRSANHKSSWQEPFLPFV